MFALGQKIRNLLLLALLATVLQACGGGSGGRGGVPAPMATSCRVAISGTRDGQPYSTEGTFVLSRSGNIVSGTWETMDGTSGTASGIISGMTLTFMLTQTEPCPGTYTGTATVMTTGEFSGNYSGTSCLGDVTTSFTSLSCEAVDPPPGP